MPRLSQERRVRASVPGGPVLLRSRLRPPAVRAGLVPRARLDGLLAQWCLADQPSRRVAWVSLDDSDDDPVRFWVDVIEAIRVVA